MRVDGVPKRANLLTKASWTISTGDPDEVVCDGHERPVCLDAVPRTHEHLAESEMLFDLLVEGFDPEALRVKTREIQLGHVQIVGDEEAKTVGLFGDEEPDVADFGQADDYGGNLKSFVLGEANAFERFQSLGQVTDVDFAFAHEHDTVFSDCDHISPTKPMDEVENLGTGIPAIHEDGERPTGEKRDGIHQNFDGQSDFAFEQFGGARFLGVISPDSPSPSLSLRFENGRNRAHSLDQAVARMMNANSFDGLALAGAGRVVEDQQRIVRSDLSEGSLLNGFLQGFEFPGRTGKELMKAVDAALSVLVGDFPDRAKFDEPD